jgi:hypothetical protein
MRSSLPMRSGAGRKSGRKTGQQCKLVIEPAAALRFVPRLTSVFYTKWCSLSASTDCSTIFTSQTIGGVKRFRDGSRSSIAAGGWAKIARSRNQTARELLFSLDGSGLSDAQGLQLEKTEFAHPGAET